MSSTLYVIEVTGNGWRARTSDGLMTVTFHDCELSARTGGRPFIDEVIGYLDDAGKLHYYSNVVVKSTGFVQTNYTVMSKTVVPGYPTGRSRTKPERYDLSHNRTPYLRRKKGR